MSRRASGIILHPTSFPGEYGAGDLGGGAKKVIDWLASSGQKYLQILPFGPTGFGDSPYQSFSTFAGNPYFISFEKLIEEGLLVKEDLSDYYADKKQINYYYLYLNNFKILKKAFLRFKKNNEYAAFCGNEDYWLSDYALFMALKDFHKSASWNYWSADMKDRSGLKELSSEVNNEAEFYKFIQWIFFRQWKDFKEYANNKGIKIIGDLPIYVSYDSADLWSNKELFLLDKRGEPEVVAGVPPDYFSVTGQLWGNPIYNWQKMEEMKFEWWIKRIKHILKNVDKVRIDHFRGFESYWEIPFGETTAINGRWVKAPGEKLFYSLKKEFGDKLKELIIAEDLGVITDDVKKLRDDFLLPGMRIFEFAVFPSYKQKKKSADAYLPENYIKNCIAYPGTHDNDTLKSWFNNLTDERKKDILFYLGINGTDNINDAVIKILMNSKAEVVLFLLQDILGLSDGHRMNTPGTTGEHNWSWRVPEELLNENTSGYLYNLTKEGER